MRWLSGASASRRGTRNAKKSGAGNVPLFYPGSRPAGRHAGISGCWSYPTGQAACVCVREAVRGGSSAGRGGGSWIFYFLFFFNAKWLETAEPGPGSCLRRSGGVDFRKEHLKAAAPPPTIYVFHQTCCAKRWNACRLGYKYFGGRSKDCNRLILTPYLPSECSWASSQASIIKMTLLWPHSDVPLPPAGRTVNGIPQ